MLSNRHAFFCVAVIATLFAACRQSAPKQDPSRENMPSALLVTDSARLLQQEQGPDLQPFFDGNHLYMSQHFAVPKGRSQVVVAKGGMEVTVDPSCLEQFDGKPPAGDIQVRIVELSSSEDFFRHNVATVSNGRLLMSGGSYYIGMSSEGQELRVRKGYKVQAKFPVLARDDMELFYGERGDDQSMNWQRAGIYLDRMLQPEFVDFKETAVIPDWDPSFVRTAADVPQFGKRLFRTKKDPVYYYERMMTLSELMDTVNMKGPVVCLDSISLWPKNLPTDKKLDTNYLISLYGPKFQYQLRRCDCSEDSIATNVKAPRLPEKLTTLSDKIRDYYDPVGIARLGWINVDRFYKEKDPVFLYVNANGELNHAGVTYFVIFKNFNGLINGKSITDSAGTFMLDKMPPNENISIVAFVKKKGTVYQAKAECNTSEGFKQPLAFKEISVKELNTLFGNHIRT